MYCILEGEASCVKLHGMRAVILGVVCGQGSRVF
jgi:hypothetical protein